MAAKKARRTRRSRVVRTAGETVSNLRKSVAGAVDQIRDTEAKVEKQLRALVRKNKLSRKDASRILSSVKDRLQHQRRSAMKQIDASLKVVQSRFRRESHAASRVAENAVRRTLAALNIPSRKEILELTAKVDALSRRIASMKRGR